MGNVDQADAYRKLQELYADMSDSRIESMAENMDDLTEIAQQVLRAEIAKRGLDAQSPGAEPVEIARHALEGEISDPDLDVPFSAPSGETELLDSEDDPAQPYQHGDKVIPQLDPHAYDPVAIWVVTDAEKARQVMEILGTAGIECYLGPGNVETVDDYKDDYAGGVEIKVMKFQARFAQNGLRATLPREPEEASAEDEEFAIRCPQCNSPDVILQGLVAEPGPGSDHAARNSWICDACGQEWADDGIVEKG